MSRRTFDAELAADGRGCAVHVPFDPDAVWGPKTVHHVAGTIGPCPARGPLAKRSPAARASRGANGRARGATFVLRLGPAWLRDCPVPTGEVVRVTLWPEGPQPADLAPDFAAALARAPKASAFFHGLAQFYRRAWLRWIDATKRSPEERTRRIRETVRLLRLGTKERPR
jgi:hypothetical protein